MVGRVKGLWNRVFSPVEWKSEWVTDGESDDIEDDKLVMCRWRWKRRRLDWSAEAGEWITALIPEIADAYWNERCAIFKEAAADSRA